MSDVKIGSLNPVQPNRPAPEAVVSETPAKAVVRALPVRPAEKESREQNSEEQGGGGIAEVKEAVAKLNDYVQSVQRDLSFEFDESSGKTVITVLDRKTQEVVRQIPDELALRLARNLQQDEPLSLFNMKV